MANQRLAIEISAGTIWRIVLIGLLLWLLFLVREVLLLLFFAFVIVSAASPIVEKLEKKRIPRTASALLIYLAFFLIVGTFFYFLIPVALEELKKLGESLPVYLQGFQIFLQDLTELASSYRLEENVKTLIENGTNRISDSLGGIFSNIFSILSGLLKVVITLSLSFYMLVKKDGVRGFLQAVIPKKHQEYAIDLIIRIQNKLGRWLIGMFSLMVIIFILNYIVLRALGVPFALLLAITGGLLEVIPYIGPTMALIPAALVALTVSPLSMVLVIVSYILIQQMENYLITPLVMKKAVGLNPVIIISAILIGGQLAGFLGVIIAVPFATAVSVFMKDILNSQNDNLENRESRTKNKDSNV